MVLFAYGREKLENEIALQCIRPNRLWMISYWFENVYCGFMWAITVTLGIRVWMAGYARAVKSAHEVAYSSMMQTFVSKMLFQPFEKHIFGGQTFFSHFFFQPL